MDGTPNSGSAQVTRPTPPIQERNIVKSRPCDACRRRKSRCVIKEEGLKCVLCEFRNHECTFLEDITPRKRKSASIADESEKSATHIARRRPSEKDEAPRLPDSTVEDYADLRGPSLLKRTLGLQRRHHSLYVGSSGRIESSIVSENHVDHANARNDVAFRRVSRNDLFILKSDHNTEYYEEEIDDLDIIEDHVAPHGRALIELYFRIVHPTFPILHKKVYLEKYERTHREFSPVLLAAVYILALDYWSYSPELSDYRAPDLRTLENLATKCLSYAINRPKLSTVEAGLLLLQRSSERTWPLTAQMVAVGQDIGLHCDCSTWDIPNWEKGLRKRLAWALYMQDKWASLICGRPSHIFRADWAARALTVDDFPENFTDENDEEGSTEVEIGRILFTQMVSLTEILSDILATLYSGRSEDGISPYAFDATKHVLMKAKPLQIRLKEWYADLPGCLSIGHVKIRKLSSSGYLHLAYWATETTLHRCIVRTLPTCSDLELVGICQGAASARLNSATMFVRDLRPEHWQSFWYFASEFNFGIIGALEALLATTYASPGEVALNSSRLNDYIWTLKMSRKTAAFLDGSIAMIDLAVKSLKKRVIPVGETAAETSTAIQDRVAIFQRSMLEEINMFETLPESHLAIPSAERSEACEDFGDDNYFGTETMIEHPFVRPSDRFD